MNLLIRYILDPVRRAWRRWAYANDPFVIAKRNTRATGYTIRGFTFCFRRSDYALILKACRITKQDSFQFVQNAALERAYLILQVENSGGVYESRLS